MKTDVYALGMVRFQYPTEYGPISNVFTSDHAGVFLDFCPIISERSSNPDQETISGKVPYHQFLYDVAIIRALDRKEPPRRPEQLSGPDERLARTWALLLACWDHDPSARPDASAVLETVSL